MKLTVKSSLLKTCISNLEALFSSCLGVWNMEVLISSPDETSILVECSGGDTYYRQVIPASVEKKGKFAVNVTFLKNLNFPGETVTLLIKDGAMSFVSGRMSGKIDTIGDKDPIVRPKELKQTDSLVMPSKLFSRLVDNILFSPTVEDMTMKMRFVADGKKGIFKVFSIDQYRLAKYEYTKPKEGEEEPVAPKEKEKGRRRKKDERAPKEVMKADIKGDFDYVFPSNFLTAVRGFFHESLKIAADTKKVRLSDDHITLFYPSSQDTTVGAHMDTVIEEQEGKTPLMEVSFHPKQAEELIDAACSANRSKDGKVILIPLETDKQMQARVSGDGIRTQCTFDLLSAKVKNDKVKVLLSASFFNEFLGLIKGFSDDKKGCSMKVWPKCLALYTANSFYLMPTLSG